MILVLRFITRRDQFEENKVQLPIRIHILIGLLWELSYLEQSQVE